MMINKTKPAAFMGLGLLVISLGIPGVSKGANPLYLEQPFAVIAIAGLDRTQANLEQLGEISGNKQPLEQFLALQSNLRKIPGLNRQRAVGCVLVLKREKLELPAAVFLLPVTNGEKTIRDLRKKFPVFQTISKGKWRVNIPGLVLYVNLQNDYLVVSRSRPTLAVVTDELLKSINTNTVKNDLFITMNFDGMSDPLRQRILNGFDIDLNKALLPKPDETDESLRTRTQIVELVRSAATHLVSDTQTLTAGLKMESDIQLNVDLQVRPDSEFENVTSKLELSQKQFSGSPQEQLPLQVDFGLNLPEPVLRVAVEIFKVARENLLQEIGPKLSESERQSATATFDVIGQTIHREELDGFVSFHEIKDQQMALLGGMTIPKSDQFAAALEKGLLYARNSENIADVEVNIQSSQPINLHRLQRQNQRKQNEWIYGSAASLYLGTSPDRLWMLVGGLTAPQLLKSTKRQTGDSSSSIVSVNFSFDPWLRLAEKHEVDIQRVQRIRQSIPDGQHDQFQFELKTSNTGLQAILHAEQGYLKLFGRAIERISQPTKSSTR